MDWQVLVVVATAVLMLVPLVVTGLKGHWVLLVAGFLVVGLVWVIAMFLPPRPGSWWDRHRRAESAQ